MVKIKKVILLFVIMLFAAGCTNSGDYSEVEGELQTIFGEDLSIMEPEGYTLIDAHVRYDSQGDLVDEARLIYSDIQQVGDLAASKEEIESKEERDQLEYIYGPYEGEEKIRVEVSYFDEVTAPYLDPNQSFEVISVGEHDAYINQSSDRVQIYIPVDDWLYEGVSSEANVSEDELLTYMEMVVN
ncbi:hypothetical protein [Alkalibacillus haloalkaliphilus]|uniref:hypothetical protein n=1 Tax=Alkalibacillus haloalkaliphilus TaxID=94136 RepID=UPI0029355696|nr:hypothetical protein [Alkalibacillus haloalkaliphilus]MDV2582778.1 hypothetical protein [Alkalibacillus haloalkaliphilus]